MTYSEKVEWLGEYLRQAALARELRQEITEMRTLMEEQRSDAAKRGGARAGGSAELLWETELLEERRMALAAQERKMNRAGRRVERAIETLHDPRQRRILRMIYLVGMTQQAISVRMGFCRRHICRCHQDGVAAIEITPEMLRDEEK